VGKHSPAPGKTGMSKREYWLGFSVFPGIGPRTFQKLLERFGNARSAWEASIGDLHSVLGEPLADKFDTFRKKFSPVDYAKELAEKKVSFLTWTDNEYPKLLKAIKNPPFVLYIRGSFRFNDLNHQSTIAVVGTRKITQYGRDVTTLLTAELVGAGFTIVSGLAMGVDAVAHQTAIENNGKTIAVLGCGVDCCIPTANQHIYNSIVKGSGSPRFAGGAGCVVSEFPLGQPPTKGSFPSRNRIIAGLSLGVLVTEGAEDSGALITADYAFKNNRKVFAVPGQITSILSKGPYKLLGKGAKLVTNAEDILKEFQISNVKSQINTNTKKYKTATKEEQEILEILENEPLHFDEIVRRIKKSSSQVGSILSLMEVKGMVKSLDSGMFSIAA